MKRFLPLAIPFSSRVADTLQVRLVYYPASTDTFKLKRLHVQIFVPIDAGTEFATLYVGAMCSVYITLTKIYELCTV